MRNLHLMKFSTEKAVFGFAASLVFAACAPRRSTAPVPVPMPISSRTPAAPAKAPLPPANPKLPAVPEINGPVLIKVIYPPAGSAVEARDSNFVFGSVGNGNAGLTVNGILAPVWPNGSFMAWLPVPSGIPATDSIGRQVMLGAYNIVAVVGTDTARLTHTVRVPGPTTSRATVADTLVPFSQPAFATLGSTTAPAILRGTQSSKCFGALPSCISAPTVLSDTDRVVIGRPTPTGIYQWFLLPGTSVRVLGTRGDYAQVQLDSEQTIWIAKSDLTTGLPTVAPARLKIEMPRIDSRSQWIDIVIPASAPPAFAIDQSDRSFTLTFYKVELPASLSKTIVSSDSYLSAVRVAGSAERTVFSIDLTAAPYGYIWLYRNGEFTLRVRRPPLVDRSLPLKGLTIAVDPGHPPIGARGPTGLWEPVPTLAIGFKVRDMLISRGANVVMTRTAHEDVDLAVRPTVARVNNAHAFVSIHLNALPDGQNPFTHHGTSTYWFHPQSTPLAQTIQKNLLGEMGLRDIGVRRGNFAVVRGTWMPSVLAEGAFIMMPDQEAAILTDQYQQQYARGIVAGLEDYFRTLGQPR